MDPIYRYTCKEVPDAYGVITYELLEPNGKVLIRTKDFSNIEHLLKHLNRLLMLNKNLIKRINQYSVY